MSTDAAQSALSWVLAGVAAATVLVVVVVVRRWAGRVLVGALGVVVFLCVLAARGSIGGLADRDVPILCAGGAVWFGVHLTAPGRLCPPGPAAGG